MHSLGLLFTSSGRVGKRDFALAAMALYAAVIGSQMLTLQWVVLHIGVWPFAIAQAGLLWLWFALHANRLRDAGRSPAPAVGVAVIDALAMIMLIVAVAFFVPAASDAATDPQFASLQNILLLYVVFYLIGAFGAPSQFDILHVVLAILVLIACIPVLITFALSLWAGTRPSAPILVPPAPPAA
jgi:uncharacterized membrane protein YhaH (DUF805 family)